MITDRTLTVMVIFTIVGVMLGAVLFWLGGIGAIVLCVGVIVFRYYTDPDVDQPNLFKLPPDDSPFCRWCGGLLYGGYHDECEGIHRL